jgi:hypothetical protein
MKQTKLRKIKWGHRCMGFIALIASGAHKMKRFASEGFTED